MTGWDYDRIGRMSEREIQFSLELAARKPGVLDEEKEAAEDLSPEDEALIEAESKKFTDRMRQERGIA